MKNKSRSALIRVIALILLTMSSIIQLTHGDKLATNYHVSLKKDIYALL